MELSQRVQLYYFFPHNFTSKPCCLVFSPERAPFAHVVAAFSSPGGAPTTCAPTTTTTTTAT